MDYLGWMNGWTDGQTSRHTAGWMARYVVNNKSVVVHCTVVYVRMAQ